MQVKVNKEEKRSWIEIDLARLEANYKALKEQLDTYSKVIAVIKADAYGHGDGRVAVFLEKECSVRNFAVSNIDEAMTLRDAGVKGSILILGYTAPQHFKTLYDNNIMQTIVSSEYADSLLLSPYKVRCQVALDTGMNRIGLSTNNAEACAETIKGYAAQGLNICGAFTHFCVADSLRPEDIAFTKTQIQRFEDVVSRLDSLHLDYVHCCNSAASLAYYPELGKHLKKYVRLGIVLYGLKPDADFPVDVNIKPAFEWKSLISMVKTIQVGESVGYGRAFTADHTMRIATIPTGYADGYSRRLSCGVGHVLINGQKAPIVGKVCMDQMMVDISEIPGVKMDDEVILLGDGLNADEMASLIGTIGYEVICNISKRVQRYYKKS